MCQDSVECGISEKSLVLLDWIYGARPKVDGLTTLPKRICFCEKNGSETSHTSDITRFIIMIPILCWVTI